MLKEKKEEKRKCKIGTHLFKHLSLEQYKIRIYKPQKRNPR